MNSKNFVFIFSIFMVLLCCVSCISAVSDNIMNDTVSEVDIGDDSISVNDDEQVIDVEDSASVAQENDGEQTRDINPQTRIISDEDSYNANIGAYGLNGDPGDTYTFVSNFNGKNVYIDKDNTTITSASGVVLTNCSFSINSGVSGVTINGLNIQNAISSCPIFVDYNCSDISITNNYIYVNYSFVNGTYLYGIDFSSFNWVNYTACNFNNINITDNTIWMYGNSYVCGIYGSDFINSNILRNTIYAYSDTGSASAGNNAVYGIALCDDSTWFTTLPRPRNNNILNNTVTVIGQSVYGIEDFGIDQNVSNNTIKVVATPTGSAYGIALAILDNATINDNIIYITVGDLTENITTDMIHGTNAGIRLHSNSTYGYYCNNVTVIDDRIYFNTLIDKESANYTFIQIDEDNTLIDITGTWDSHYWDADPYSPIYPSNMQQNIISKVGAKELLGAIDSPILGESSIIYVDPVNGNDNNNGSKSSPVKTRSKAYELVSNGGTIFLEEGTYSDMLSLQNAAKSVSFVGANREKTILAGKNTAGMTYITFTDEGYVDFYNLTIKSMFSITNNNFIMHSKCINVTFDKESRGDGALSFTKPGTYLEFINCSFNQRTFSFGGAANAYNVNFTSCTFTNGNNMFTNSMGNNNISLNYCSFINCANIVKTNNGNFNFNNSYFAMNDNPSSIAKVNIDNWVVMTFENTTEILNEYDDNIGFLVSLTKLAHADGNFTDLENSELLALPSYEVKYILTNGTEITHTLENLKDETILPITGFGTMSATIADSQTLRITIGHNIILNIEKYDAIGYGGEQELTFISNYNDITGTMSVTITGPNYSKKETLDIYGGRSFLTLKGLNVGEYTIDVAYSGDDLYYPQTNSTTFNVLPVASDDITLKVYANDIAFGEAANILVFVGPNGATGNVTITIDGNGTTATLDENGMASFSIKDLAVKNYTIDVKYNGDTNFETASTPAKLTVMANPVIDELNQTKQELNQTKTDLANKTAEAAKTQEQVTKLTQENTKLTSDLKTSNQKAATASNNANAKIKKIKAAKTVKKSKKYTITVTLNKKVKGKFVYVAFNGKVYKAKTNANGIAKITIKKSALKKLAGKKVKYQVISGNSLKNNSVKIKK